MLFHIGKNIPRKLHKSHRSSIAPLNLKFGLEALCEIYTAELRRFLEDKRENLVNSTEGDPLDLVINAPEFDFENLIRSLSTHN